MHTIKSALSLIIVNTAFWEWEHLKNLLTQMFIILKYSKQKRFFMEIDFRYFVFRGLSSIFL